MNVAKSDDNTYAITDLSLEELVAIWHLEADQLIVTGDNPVTMDVLIEAAKRQSERYTKRNVHSKNRGKK